MSFFESSSWKGEQKALSTLAKCGACGLFKTCKSPKMPPSGAGKRRILFVGEAPGSEEDERGEQFVGDAGRCLRRLLNELDFDLDSAWKTNSSICRPPGNKIEDLHVESCRPNLTNAIKELKPNVVVLLGASAVKGLIPTEWNEEPGPISKWVGWTIPSPTYRAWLCPTYHPSYLIRSKEDPTLMREVRRHLRQALDLEHVPAPYLTLEALSGEVEVITDPSKGLRRLKALVDREGELAWDYETTGLKPERKEQRIYSASFCLDGKDTFATPYTDEMADTLRAILVNPRLRKIASNLKFETRWSIRKLGVTPLGWEWDTMLAAHVLDNRPGISSIKFQGYINYGVGEYNTWAKEYLQAKDANGLNRIHEAPIKDVLSYNAIDSLMEYKVAQIQKKQMGMM